MDFLGRRMMLGSVVSRVLDCVRLVCEIEALIGFFFFAGFCGRIGAEVGIGGRFRVPGEARGARLRVLSSHGVVRVRRKVPV